MLNFFPEFKPWSFITRGMTGALPAGKFYIYADDMVPRSSKPTKFILETDNKDPVRITVNNVYVGTVIPTNIRMPVFLELFKPPTINQIHVNNGVDTPVHLQVAATYMTNIWESSAKELYELAGKTVEQYFNLVNSRFSSFFIDYQLPWRQTLSDIRSLRILSVKSAAITLFNQHGAEKSIIEFLSGLCHTTPAFKETRNPELWQPDLIQTVTSGEDMYGFETHFWMPNLCLSRWVAFSKLFNNVKALATINKFGHELVSLAPKGTNLFETHVFDTLDSSRCSVHALLEFLGCLDNITAAAGADIREEVPICAFATPFDQTVEHPGIGGSFLDSGTLFDSIPIPSPPSAPFDSIYDIDILTDYWVGANLRKAFDFGKCIDVHPTKGVLIEDSNCCMEGPDAVLLTTLKTADSVLSTITPIHPIFGGGDIGILDNPYFDELI